MNLIQTLTNENPTLILILSFPLLLIDWFLFLKTSDFALNLSAPKKNKILFIVLNSLLGVFILLLPNDLIKDVLNVLQFILSVHFIFKQNIKSQQLLLYYPIC